MDPPVDESRLFADEKGFFRARPAGLTGDPRFDGWVVDDGPEWSDDEARRAVRDFLDRLADGRDVVDHDDLTAHARENGLVVLFGPNEQERFERLYARMPEAMAAEWRELLSGGRSSEAFGPLTLQEQLDEAKVEEELSAGARRRTRNLAIGAAALVALVALGIFALQLGGDDERTAGGIRLGGDATGDELDRAGGPPVAEPALTASLDTPVVVRAGTGDVGERIVDPAPADVLPQPPRSVSFSLFQYAGAAQVVLVGPPGWVDTACAVVSVASGDLRPFDTVYVEGEPGACGTAPIGHAGVVGCRSDTVVMVALAIPAGPVELAEGGTGFADTVRAQLVRPADGYQTASVRGAVVVDEDAEARVPAFGGEVGTEVTFDLPGASGSCTLG